MKAFILAEGNHYSQTIVLLVTLNIKDAFILPDGVTILRQLNVRLLYHSTVIPCSYVIGGTNEERTSRGTTLHTNIYKF